MDAKALLYFDLQIFQPFNSLAICHLLLYLLLCCLGAQSQKAGRVGLLSGSEPEHRATRKWILLTLCFC